VQLDLNEAAEDAAGLGRLGNDLRSLNSIDGPFERARDGLSRRLLALQLTHPRFQAVAELLPDEGQR
jgi:hypothetical protein